MLSSSKLFQKPGPSLKRSCSQHGWGPQTIISIGKRLCKKVTWRYLYSNSRNLYSNSGRDCGHENKNEKFSFLFLAIFPQISAPQLLSTGKNSFLFPTTRSPSAVGEQRTRGLQEGQRTWGCWLLKYRSGEYIWQHFTRWSSIPSNPHTTTVENHSHSRTRNLGPRTNFNCSGHFWDQVDAPVTTQTK